MDRVLVIVVTYNGMKWIDRCLGSVRESSLKSDLFIVDNGSSDGSIEYIRENYPDAQFIESKQNLGFGKANNLGFEYAINNMYDYVYLLNQDAWIEEETLRQLINIQKSHSDYGILSPLQTNKEKNRLDQNFIKFACPEKLISDAICNNSVDAVYDTRFAMAAHWLLPINTIKTVGGFSPTFTQYGEDNNYVDRLYYFNQKVGIVPECRGVHDRENRELSVKKRIHIDSMHWRNYLSDPLHSRKTNVKKALYSFLSLVCRYPWITSKKMICLLIEYRKIKKNCQLSRERGAFLFDTKK